MGNYMNLQDSPTRGQAGGVLTGNHVNLHDSPPEARLVSISRESCKLTGFPDQKLCW